MRQMAEEPAARLMQRPMLQHRQARHRARPLQRPMLQHRQFDQGRIAECQVGWPLSVGWVRSLLGLVAASSMVKPAASAAVEATLVASASEPSLWLLVLGFIVLCSGFAFIAGILVGLA